MFGAQIHHTIRLDLRPILRGPNKDPGKISPLHSPYWGPKRVWAPNLALSMRPGVCGVTLGPRRWQPKKSAPSMFPIEAQNVFGALTRMRPGVCGVVRGLQWRPSKKPAPLYSPIEARNDFGAQIWPTWFTLAYVEFFWSPTMTSEKISPLHGLYSDLTSVWGPNGAHEVHIGICGVVRGPRQRPPK